jgi:hypothetical protein
MPATSRLRATTTRQATAVAIHPAAIRRAMKDGLPAVGAVASTVVAGTVAMAGAAVVVVVVGTVMVAATAVVVVGTTVAVADLIALEPAPGVRCGRLVAPDQGDEAARAEAQRPLA